LVIIDRMDGLATILQDQTTECPFLGEAEEITEAFRDTISLQVAKFQIECELFSKSVDRVGSSSQLGNYVEGAPGRGECSTHDRLAPDPRRILEGEGWARSIMSFVGSKGAMLIAAGKPRRCGHG